MKIEQLYNLESLEKKELIIRITGEVQETNFDEFEKQSLIVISGINRKLETDEHFAEAEQNIKFCKTIANRIANARNDALHRTKAISELIATTSRVEAKFDEVRLILTKLVGTEKERRKNEIINSAKNRLNGLLLHSPVKHGFAIDHAAIYAAAKGKRSLAKMQEDIDEVAETEELRLSEMEIGFTGNIEKIEKTEKEWPGLFPDKQNMALSAPETVDAIIVGRVSDHRLKVEENKRKQEYESKLAEEKREAERHSLQENVESIPVESEPVDGIPQDSSWQPEYLPMPDDPFTDLPYPLQKKYVITVITQSDAASSTMMADIISSLHGVIEVTVVSE